MIESTPTKLALFRRSGGLGVWLIGAALLLVTPTAVLAQAAPAETTPSAADTPAPEGPEEEELRARLAGLEAQILKQRATAEEWAAKAREFEEARATAPARLATLEAEIETLDAAPPPPSEQASVDELEAQLLGAEQDLAIARGVVTDLEARAADRPERRLRIPELLADAKKRLQDLKDEAPMSADTAPALFDARQRLVTARTRAGESEIAAYQAELASFDVRGQLLSKSLDRASRRVAGARERIAALRQAASDRKRVAAAADAARDAERERLIALEAESMPESVQSLARELVQENQELAAQRAGEEGVSGKIDDVRRKLARADERLAQVEADYERLIKKVEAAGLSDSVGLLLRKQRSEVPDPGKYRRFIRMRQELISSVRLEQIERREQRAQLANIDRAVEKAMAKVDERVPPESRQQIESLLRDLFETKRKYLDSLIEDYETYFQNLVDFDARQQELIGRTEDLLEFVDARVLWIPSSRAIRPTLLTDAWEASAWLLSPRFLGQLGRAMRDVLTRAPLLAVVILAAGIGFLALRRRIHDRLSVLAEQAREPTCIRDALTWEACGLTLLLTPWWPGLLAYLAWQLSVSADATQYVRCAAYGAASAAVIWITLELPRQLLRKNGIVEAHLGAAAETIRSLRNRLTWLSAVAVPSVFVIQMLELRAEDAWRESLGRLLFVIAMLAVIGLLQSALRENGGAIWSIAQHTPNQTVRRWVRRFAHIGFVLVGLLLAAGALRGYYWTANRLAASFHFTLFFLFLLLVVFRLCVRWSMLAGRRLALEQQQRERVERTADGEYEGIDVDGGVDLDSVDLQTSRLIKSAATVAFLLGMWVIWADLLPAAGLLREVELWSTTQAVTVETANAAGERSLFVEDRVLPVTLADVLFALILAGMTLGLVRNLPGFLEMTIFRRLAAGERYAYGTLAKYTVSLLGAALVFNQVGIGWSNIQWLVAAVGLGLGFGLQEIFANFVSGLIILFERPIRVGDTVTVGDISGVVSRIRIRATWITGFDRKELVVPNKEFVTNQLVNWSLSDPISRVEIKVGIAYGSDTEAAIVLLQRVAEANPKVLREPAPAVLFLGFGESSLDFELRVFSPDVESRLPIVHGLHMAIDAAFRAEGIEIAFPQRDLHVRSVPAGPST